ncbi:MAG: amidohydrolase family protein, partial [Bacillota bacterium]
KAAIENVKALMQAPPAGARILGVHLEGNYFAPKMAGAQNPEYLYAPADDDYMDFIGTGIVRRVSCAPELAGALDMAEKLADLGIQMSIGHSDGRPIHVEKGAEAGFTSLTHIFNAQSALTSVFLYPDGGVCEASLINDGITVECICDGNHLSPTLLKMIYRLKGADNMIAITDSTFSGAPDGDYVFGGLPVVVGNNICLLKDGSAFAGSVATMDLCLRTLYKKAEIPLVEAVRICSLTPARLIKEKNVGCIKTGNYADVVVFDEDIHIIRSFVMGREFTS